MLRFFRNKLTILLLAGMPLFMMTSCNDDTNKVLNNILDYINELLNMLGWDPATEDTDIPEGGEYTDDINDPVNLENYFPPIGNQGEYGTCVAWATGYALKTSLDKKANSSLDVTNPANQTSPVDLWYLISPSEKTVDKCNGTNFDPAFNAMINKGAKSMQMVPFTNSKMTCDNRTSDGDNNRKLGSYRIIAYTNELSGQGTRGMTVENFKGYLKEHGPIAIGARLGDNFMNCKSSSVLTSETYNYAGQHAYHALVVVGFDDSKQAFRVRNSWGTAWGDRGSIWIGYNFFVQKFCFGAWVASNSGDLRSASASLRSTGSASDLQMEISKDYQTTNGSRIVEYDIKNTGSTTINASKNWSVVYLLFRKNRINEKYILFQDYYSNEGTRGRISSYSDGVAITSQGNTVTNINIASGSSAAEAMGGTHLTFEYTLPLDKDGNELNGDFYMVLIADAFGNVDETEKENNFCFLTGRNGEPVKIANGKIINIPTQLRDVRTLVSASEPNNYSGIEIQQILERQFKNGMLTKLAQQESGLRSGRVAKQVK